MRVLDLFCGAGGASMGYRMAFGPDVEIVGVDIAPQPRYPFTFVQADATTFDVGGFDFAHASPPCHDHSRSTGTSRKQVGPKGTGWMLGHTVDRLRAAGVPWVVENVEGAKMPPSQHEFRLCGSMFGLDVRRHRLFATDLPLSAPPCNHPAQTPRFRSLQSKNRKAGVLASVVGVHGHTQYAGEFELRCAAMGIDWMTNDELCQSIPPAYTRWIGGQI